MYVHVCHWYVTIGLVPVVPLLAGSVHMYVHDLKYKPSGATVLEYHYGTYVLPVHVYRGRVRTIGTMVHVYHGSTCVRTYVHVYHYWYVVHVYHGTYSTMVATIGSRVPW